MPSPCAAGAVPIGPNQLGRDDPYAAKPSTSPSRRPGGSPRRGRSTESAISSAQPVAKCVRAKSTSASAVLGGRPAHRDAGRRPAAPRPPSGRVRPARRRATGPRSCSRPCGPARSRAPSPRRPRACTARRCPARRSTAGCRPAAPRRRRSPARRRSTAREQRPPDALPARPRSHREQVDVPERRRHGAQIEPSTTPVGRRPVDRPPARPYGGAAARSRSRATISVGLGRVLRQVQRLPAQVHHGGQVGVGQRRRSAMSPTVVTGHLAGPGPGDRRPAGRDAAAYASTRPAPVERRTRSAAGLPGRVVAPASAVLPRSRSAGCGPGRRPAPGWPTTSAPPRRPRAAWPSTCRRARRTRRRASPRARPRPGATTSGLAAPVVGRPAAGELGHPPVLGRPRRR